MNKIEKLEKERERNLVEKGTIEAKAKKLKAEAAELMKKAEQAAEAGDLETYKNYKSQADDTSAAAYVAHAQLEAKLRPITKETALDAWNDYSKAMQKNAKAAEAEFLGARDKLTETFTTWMETLKEARAMRKRLGNLMGLQGENFDTETALGIFSIPFPQYDLAPEFRYFVTKLGEAGEGYWGMVDRGLME